METIRTRVGIETPETAVSRRLDPSPLDQVLASRSHVRVLRAMITSDPSENLGPRDVARLAGVSYPRTAKVLGELSGTGLVVRHRTRWGAIYELNDAHFLAPQLWAIFDDELHVLESVQGYVRGEARRTRRAVRIRLEPGIGHDLDVVMTSAGRFGPEDKRWFEELEEEIGQRFGLDVRVAARDPDDWLMKLD